LLAEIFHHVVAFKLTVNEYIEADLFLKLDGAPDLSSEERFARSLIPFSGFVFRPPARTSLVCGNDPLVVAGTLWGIEGAIEA
jgi:hypothetical protein